ncbi:MAG: type II toxin-antitoxin system VapC family toxin [Hormoscilla sp.]
MRRIFLDTSYLVALADRDSDLHQRAEAFSQQLSVFAAITSEMVLTELLNYFCERGAYFRQIAITLTFDLRNDRFIEIVPQTPELFERAFKFYQNRMDKGYSVTDCV